VGVYLSLPAQLLVDVVIGIPFVSISLFGAKVGLKRIRIVRTVEHRRQAIETFKSRNPELESDEERQFVTAWDQKHIGMTFAEATEEAAKNPLILQKLKSDQ